MAKPVPVLQLNQFQVPATLHPHFYVQRLNEHLAHFEFIQKAHRHDFYCLFLFTRGTGKHIIDFESYEVVPGSMFFMSPAQMHSWQLSDDTDGYVIFFNSEFYFLNHTYKSLTDFPFFHYTSTPAVLLSGQGKEAIGDLFARIYQEYRGAEQRKDEVICSYLHILLIKLANAYTQSNKPAFSSHLLDQIRKLESLIEKHYLQHRSVEEYASWMHLSVKQLYTICQVARQKSLSALLQERIILEAKRLLVHTELSVAQVAAQLNYTDNSYFSRYFKKATGQTPELFRQQYR